MSAFLLHDQSISMVASFPLASIARGAVEVDFDLTVLGQAVAFSILIIILKPLLFDPLLKVFEERERRTDGAKVLARRMDEQAGELLRRYDTELEKVRRIAGEEREHLRSEGQKVEARIMSETREEVAKILNEGRAKIRAEADQLRRDLKTQIPLIAREVAGQAIGREVA
jgi:F-type H+-transporting ATPase subunit b